MLKKDVTVLVYLHNNSDTIDACLNSVITMQNQFIKEIIVIDDGSFDGSSELLTRFAQIKIVKHEFLGITKSINEQLKNIGDNDFVRIDGNVVIQTPNWFELLQNTAYLDEENGIVGVRLLFADSKIESDGRIFINGLGYEEKFVNVNKFKMNDGCKPQITEVDSVSSAFSYYKNAVLKKVGFLDENYFPLYTEDDDYCISARKCNFFVVANSFIQAYHFIPVKTPTDLPMAGDNEKFISPFRNNNKLISEEHFKYWNEKWLWDLKYPDLNLIRYLYGSTKICWNIGERLKFSSAEEFPTVDCCLVTWNNLPLLKRMMESLAVTEYPKEKITIYVTDNGSNDGTIEYLKQLSTEFIFKVYSEFLPVNSGVAYGLNIAVIKGKGELIARLDDDIILPPEWLKNLVKVILKRPYCGMTGPKVLNDNANHSIQCADFVLFPSYSTHENEQDKGQADYFSKSSHLRGCCNLYRRDVFKNCGLFDIRFSPSQFDDPDHQVALQANGYEIIYNGHVNIIHKLNSGVNNSYAGLSNTQGNQLKFYGKWGYNIYEILDKSIELSYEGRLIDINKKISYTLAAKGDHNYTLNEEFCQVAEGIVNYKMEKKNEFNYFIESLLNNAINQVKLNSLINASSILNLTLNLDPARISTILLLYLVYYRIGDIEKANHYKDLIGILNRKNIDKFNLQNSFDKDKYFNEVISHLNMDAEHSTLEQIIERLIIINQFNLALFISMFLFDDQNKSRAFI
jgi:GT2 family glycosyltransferase